MPTTFERTSNPLRSLLLRLDERHLKEHLDFLDEPTDGSRDVLVERLAAAVDRDLETLLREGAWYLRDWNEHLKQMGMQPRRSFASVAREVARVLSPQPSGDASQPADAASASPSLTRSPPRPHIPIDEQGGIRSYQLAAHDAVLGALHTALQDTRPGALLHLGTGGGKTFVANEIVTSWLGQRGGYVLWVTKDWWLLRQAAATRQWRSAVDQQSRSHWGRMRGNIAQFQNRLGGTHRHLHLDAVPDETVPRAGMVVYTTLQTFDARLRADKLPAQRPSLVVWDECHWAESAKLGKRLRGWLRGVPVVSPILGLTATPRSDSPLDTAYSMSFSELVDAGYLARPLPETVGTGVQWSPSRSARGRGDFDTGSLDDLAQTPERNQVILGYYREHASKLGKTLVFACNIDHANTLAELAMNHGIGAAAVHSGNTDALNQELVDGFTDGTFDLLINVAKMTHGVDIPEIESVFLCRPTTSDILFAQMAGRGARIAEDGDGPDFFHLIEFTDNLDRFGDALVTAQRHFDGAVPGADRPTLRTIDGPYERHEFDAAGQFRTLTMDAFPTEIVEAISAPVSYREGQTFGVEIELTQRGRVPAPGSSEWQNGARAVHRAVCRRSNFTASEPVARYGVGDHRQWTTEYDRSAGWEVVSRVLQGQRGVEELVRVIHQVGTDAEAVGLRVNYRTGLHLHLGWERPNEQEDRTAARLVRLLQWTHFLEPWLATLVAPSRVAQYDGRAYDVDRANTYCKPVSALYSLAYLSGTSPTLSELEELARDNFFRRFGTINLSPYWSTGAVEVRMHGGTTDVGKVTAWLTLWTAILWMAERGGPPIDEFTARQTVVPSPRLPPGLAGALPAHSRRAILSWASRRQLEIEQLWGDRDELRGHWAQG